MGCADVYSQPEAPDPVLPVKVVRELVPPHLSDEVRLAGMAVDESGGEARVYLFDRAGTAGGVAVRTRWLIGLAHHLWNASSEKPSTRQITTTGIFSAASRRTSAKSFGRTSRAK